MNALEYAQEFIRFDSTCHRSNCEVSDYAEEALQRLGCETERIEYRDDNDQLKVNVLGRFGGKSDSAASGSGGLAWFGHTDVVVSDDWSVAEHGPFEPTVRDGRLYGRGSTDMKGPMGCMFAALESVQEEPLEKPIYVSCSSDEEINHRGAVEITQKSQLYRQLVQDRVCGVVGEATSLDAVFAHKGGCLMTITARGKAAHSSTREGLNANWAMIPFLQEVKSVYEQSESDPAWHDELFDPPTICMNVGINDHTRALNITAPQSICTLGFRPMRTTNVEEILNRIGSTAERMGLHFEVKTHHAAFYRDPASEFIQECSRLGTGRTPRTVAYGSEASNFTEVENLVVLGPGDIGQAHKSDEWITLDQLQQGEDVYRRLIQRYCQ